MDNIKRNEFPKSLVKRHVTLIEMMIVMFLIAMIIGVVGYNYQGSLEEGKVFKTKAGIEKVRTILSLKLAEDPSAVSTLASNWQDYIRQSPLAQNAASLLKDGWGNSYEVSLITKESGEDEITVTSRRFEDYKNKHPEKFAN